MPLSKSAAIVTLAVTLMGLSTPTPVIADTAKAPFKLRVEEDATKRNQPTLRRQDIRDNKDSDPFQDATESLDPTPGAFAPTKAAAPPRPQKPFNLQASDEGGGQRYQPAMPMSSAPDMSGEEDPTPARNMAPPPPQQQPLDPNDPDSWPDMQLAWDQWHARVARAIYDRYNFFAKAAFRQSPPLKAVVSYVVTRDGHIINMNMQERSPNILYNVVVYQVIKSLDGDMNLLAFPNGSRRMMVPKAGTFSQNYGSDRGFRYITNDKELIHGQQR
jgi:hypothetical protein